MEKTENNFKSYAIILGGLLLLGLIVFGLEKLASQDKELRPIVTVDDTKILGNADAATTLVEYSDFQCPACAAYDPLVRKLHEDFPDTLKIVYRYFPLATIHKNAVISAKAAEAAHRQGKFWEMHDRLFDHQKDWAEENDPSDIFRGYAREIGLDMERFESDLRDESLIDPIKSDEKKGKDDDIPGTPTFFLNGKKLTNPKNYEEFRKLITDLP